MAKRRKKLTTKRPKKPPLRLVYVEAGSINGNPRNWRTHPDGQLSAVRGMLDDDAIGWAGALLYNEQTSQLIDGHGRLKICDPAEVVPVLVGNWSPDAERKILTRLDTSTMMAGVDAEALQSLVDDIGEGGEAFADLDALLVELLGHDDGTPSAPGAGTGGGEGGQAVHLGSVYQVVVQCDDEADQQRAYDLLIAEGFKCRVNTID